MIKPTMINIRPIILPGVTVSPNINVLKISTNMKLRLINGYANERLNFDMAAIQNKAAINAAKNADNIQGSINNLNK